MKPVQALVLGLTLTTACACRTGAPAGNPCIFSGDMSFPSGIKSPAVTTSTGDGP
jgi:hypothetical protein